MCTKIHKFSPLYDIFCPSTLQEQSRSADRGMDVIVANRSLPPRTEEGREGLSNKYTQGVRAEISNGRSTSDWEKLDIPGPFATRPRIYVKTPTLRAPKYI